MPIQPLTHPKRFFMVVCFTATLAACGGGGDTGGSNSSPTTNGGSSTGTSSASGGTWLDSIFLQSGGSGYMSFASSKNSSGQYTGIASEQLFTSNAASSVFSEQTNVVIGQYSATLSRMTLVTGSGDFSTLGMGNDIQIYSQSQSGFTFGLGGSPEVLQATLTSVDVSGQSIISVATDANGGVAHTLAADTATMPPGSTRYTTAITATTPVLLVQTGTTALSQTLAQLQQQYGGTISTLGDASYLSGMSASAPVSAYATFNGAVYPASYAGVGQALPLALIADTSVGYNRTAAASIETELQGHAAAL